jgi:hypothetical protein
MPGLRKLGRASAVAAGILLLLTPATPADARKFQMSGTWLMRRGSTFIPLQFGATAGGSQRTHASMGYFTEAPFDPPVQVVSSVAAANATGASPATLELARHRFVRSGGVQIPFSGTMLVQITTMLEIDAPYATVTLMAGGGPGSFTWCPSNPACTAGGPVPGPSGNNGRVVYVAGHNRFGGTMQMGLRGGGLVSGILVGLCCGRIAHVPHPFGGIGPTLRRLAVGGGAIDAPSSAIWPRGPVYVTVPTMFPAMGSLILHPGPFVTTMLGNTATMPSGMKLQVPPLDSVTTEWGFPHTTGTVIVQQDRGSGGDDFFVVMGSDLRTPLGAGNLSTVAGGLARRSSDELGSDTYAGFDRVSRSFGAPVPSLSPSSIAAAGILLLLAAGYAIHRPRARVPDPSRSGAAEPR